MPFMQGWLSVHNPVFIFVAHIFCLFKAGCAILYARPFFTYVAYNYIIMTRENLNCVLHSQPNNYFLVSSNFAISSKIASFF